MEKEIENKKIPDIIKGKKLIGWQHYWNEAEFAKEKNREKLKDMGWRYKWLPPIWMFVISVFSSWVCGFLIILHQFHLIEEVYLTFIFPYWVYMVVPIGYLLFLLWIISKVKDLIDILRKD